MLTTGVKVMTEEVEITGFYYDCRILKCLPKQDLNDKLEQIQKIL